MDKYNDFAIISPEKIEQMAREYALKKNNNKLIKNTVEIHKLKTNFQNKDNCYTYITEANACIEKLLSKNSKNNKLNSCKENIKKITLLYETFFADHDLKVMTLDIKLPDDKKIVSLMLKLTEELLPLSTNDTIQDIIKTALNTIEIAVL